MARRLRHDPYDGWHHVMNRGINHEDVFHDDNDRLEFGARLADIHQRFGVETHAYCLMTNHYHLLLHCPDGGLSAAMQRLGAVYTRHVNDRLGRDGAIFRGRFHSRPIDSDAYLLAACRYIHRNPLDLARITTPDEYRWSSHRTYLGHRRQPAWLSTDVVLGLVGGVDAFDRFVSADLASTDRSVSGARDVVRLVQAATMVLAECAGSLEAADGSTARSLVLVWAAGNPFIDDGAVATALSMTGPGAWRSAVTRARAKMRTHPELAEVIDRSLSLVAVTPLESRSGSDPDRDQVSPNRDQTAERAAS